MEPATLRDTAILRSHSCQVKRIIVLQATKNETSGSMAS